MTFQRYYELVFVENPSTFSERISVIQERKKKTQYPT